MGGRPWDDNSQSGMRLNYLQRVHLQTKKKGAKANVSVKRILFLDKHRCCRMCLNQKLSSPISPFGRLAPKLHSKKWALNSPVTFVCLQMGIIWLTIGVASCFCFFWVQGKMAVSSPTLQITWSCEQEGFVVAGSWLCPRRVCGTQLWGRSMPY